ncbi:MAG: hypothetical protein MRZ79_24935 [Bacteroidia bacterium]|nr:hypothetical protein [Bacteroidia bacterium]
MFNPQRPLLKSASNAPGLLVEPHVEYYDIATHDRGEVTFPFQLMAYTLLLFVGLGYFNFFMGGTSNMTLIVFWVYCIFTPFYFPGIYHFMSYFKREKQKSVEIDLKHQLVTYEDGVLGKKLHFGAESVQSATIYHSQLFPYGIDYAVLQLAGGEKIVLSSLLISPWKLLTCLELEYEVVKKVFNGLPPH